MYDVQMIARYIINRCAEAKYPICNLKLNKLLYFAQAEFLVGAGKPCFENDVEAWDHGPVVPAVYFEYKTYGATNIPAQDNSGFERIDAEDKDRLNAIIDDAAQFSSTALTEITRKQKPWKEAVRRTDKIIRKPEIQAYFAE